MSRLEFYFMVLCLASCGGATSPQTAIEDSLRIEEVATLDEEPLAGDTVEEMEETTGMDVVVDSSKTMVHATVPLDTITR